MAKGLLQDVIKIKHIRKESPEMAERMPPSTPSNNSFSNIPPNIPPKTPPRMPPPRDFDDGDDRQIASNKYSLWFVALISVVFLLFGLSFVFAGAKITINPKIEKLTLNNESFSASKEVTEGGDTAGSALLFDLVVVSEEETKTIPGVLEKEVVSAKAKGKVIIYNAFSSASQTLVINTRLEGTNGKIYKIEKQVVVPGMSGGTPGSVEVGVYAAEAGESYNAGPMDFTIVGFKGTSKYSKFYARSKAPIAGGASGNMPKLSTDEKGTALAELKTALQAKLLRQTVEQIPEGFYLFKDATFSTFEEPVYNSQGEDEVLISMKGTLYGFLFSEQELTKKIAETLLADYDGGDIYISNFGDLSFTLANKETILFWDVVDINFNLSGQAEIIHRVDAEKLTKDILGKSKKEFNQILSLHKDISSANVAIRPFWKGSFPEKEKNIKVIVNYPK